MVNHSKYIHTNLFHERKGIIFKTSMDTTIFQRQSMEDKSILDMSNEEFDEWIKEMLK